MLIPAPAGCRQGHLSGKWHTFLLEPARIASPRPFLHRDGILMTEDCGFSAPAPKGKRSKQSTRVLISSLGGHCFCKIFAKIAPSPEQFLSISSALFSLSRKSLLASGTSNKTCVINGGHHVKCTDCNTVFRLTYA